jgi:hypothetical protein
VGELLPVAGNEVQPRLDRSQHVDVGGGGAVEQHHRADVHVRARVFDGEERGVEAAEAVGVRHGRAFSQPSRFTVSHHSAALRDQGHATTLVASNVRSTA